MYIKHSLIPPHPRLVRRPHLPPLRIDPGLAARPTIVVELIVRSAPPARLAPLRRVRRYIHRHRGRQQSRPTRHVRRVQVGAGAVTTVGQRLTCCVGSQPAARIAMPRVTTNATTRVMVVRRCRSTGAGRRVSLGVARMPALVGRRCTLAHKAVDVGMRMHRGLIM